MTVCCAALPARCSISLCVFLEISDRHSAYPTVSIEAFQATASRKVAHLTIRRRSCKGWVVIFLGLVVPYGEIAG